MTGELLTPAQFETFRSNGSLVVRGMYSAEEMARIRDWANEAQEWPETPGKYMMYFEQSSTDRGARILNRLENFVAYHDGFRRLVHEDRMAGAVSQLFGEPAVLFKDKINFKMPGGDGFTPHQDVQAGWSRYASIHITALISIDRTSIANGCLEMASGPRERGLIGAEWSPLSEAELRDAQFQYLETEPGDAVFFDSFVPHRSGPNRTHTARRVLYITYNKRAEGDHLARYYADKRQSYPPDIEREPGKTYRFRV